MSLVKSNLWKLIFLYKTNKITKYELKTYAAICSIKLIDIFLIQLII